MVQLLNVHTVGIWFGFTGDWKRFSSTFIFLVGGLSSLNKDNIKLQKDN